MLPVGLRIKQFSQIKTEIEQNLVQALGELNLAAPSVLATIVGIFAEREAHLWEQLAAVYGAASPGTAEGYSLDGICALNGLIRTNYTYSTVTCQLTAVPRTKIPANSMVAVQNSLELFATSKELVITSEQCYRVKLEVKQLNNIYYLTIDQQCLTLKVEGLKTKEAIAQGLVDLIAVSATELEAANNGAEITITAKTDKPFACLSGDGLIILECTNTALLVACQRGAVAAPPGSLTSIHTPIAGWLACDNPEAALMGQNRESDQALRLRRRQSIKLGGSGTLEAIRANLLNLNGVSAVSLYENQTSQTDERGLPPHAFEALVTGGIDLEIARIIWQKKPAGIQAYGQIKITVLDSEQRPQVVSFSRPIPCFIYGKITIMKTKDFSTEAAVTIKAKLLNQINSLGVGHSIVLKSLFYSIFSEPGVANAVIKLGSSKQETEPPLLKKNNVTIAAHEVALTDTTKLIIVLKDF